MADVPTIYRVMENEAETDDTRVIWFGGRMSFQPGRFFMVWLPGIDEKPYAISHLADGYFGITVEKRGRFSTALCGVKKGDGVGFRGPYGRGFDAEGARLCIVAGGMGIAALARLHQADPEAPVLYGARTADEIIYRARFNEMRFFTDDGSFGEKGFPTDALPEVIDEHRIDLVYTCGPEVMMHRVFAICEEHHIECQASLERYMKCGLGLCGMCACDDRLVCRDGPVFGTELLRRLTDFGRTAMGPDGARVPLDDYFRPKGE